MTGSSGISAVIVSCEDGEVIEPCLASVAGWVDETVVVDMMSSDGTRAIAARHGARIVDHPRMPFVEPVRPFAISQAAQPWVLLLDPDERVLPALAGRLRDLAREDAWDVIEIPRIQIAFGRSMTTPGTQDGAQPRFLRRSQATWPAEIHELPAFEGLRRLTLSADPAWREQHLAIVHDTWRSPHQVFEKFSRYIPGDAERRLARGETFTVSRAVKAVTVEFTQRFVRGRAYEDGMAGLLHASLFAVMELGVHAEMWYQQGRPPSEDAVVRRWGRRTAPLRHLTNLLLRHHGVGRRLRRFVTPRADV